MTQSTSDLKKVIMPFNIKDYKLICCNEAPYNGRIYYLENNKRRWIPSPQHMEAYSFSWDAVENVSASSAAAYELTAPLINPLVTYSDAITTEGMRDFLGQQLSGNGLEFGAASRPIPTCLSCNVDYADVFDHNSQHSPYYNNNTYLDEMVQCRYITGFEEMNGVSDASLDFMIASHIIEHVRNPLLAIENAWHKLKQGGKLLLIVPHKDLTFDAKRELTTQEHFILDYKRPLRERDFLHFVEFFEKAFASSNPFEKAMQEFNNKNGDIHYHTWNEDSFFKMIQYFSDYIQKWSVITHYKHLKQQGANEFYFLLEK